MILNSVFYKKNSISENFVLEIWLSISVFCPKIVNRVSDTYKAGVINFSNKLLLRKDSEQIVLKKTHELLELSIVKTPQPLVSLEMED